MASLDEIRGAREKKRDRLSAESGAPYPVSSRQSGTLRALAEEFEARRSRGGETIVGRIMALRGQGGIIFADLFDGTGSFQALLKRDELPAEEFSRWRDAVDVGDCVEVSGALFLTKKDEKTILASSWRMLAKSLRPLPEKWHGLKDVEERFRRRYLDLLMNEAVRARFVLRSRIVAALRAILDADGFLEVETSILQPLAGGANAAPFKTHHNALDIDLYLRIAPELDLKKLIVSGFPKVYEIGRNFRNEGIDVTHNPEFTTVEWYAAWSDALRERGRVERVLTSVIKNVTGNDKVLFDGTEIDFGKPFATVSYFEILERYALIANPEKATRESLALRAARLGVSVHPADSAEKILDNIYKKAVRPKLMQPTVIVGYPKDYLPLAKGDEKNPSLADAFQVVVGGMELVKAFSELNDPVEQRARFTHEEENKKAGDTEAQSNDEEFLEALEFGCPPAGGVGLSIDRLTMLLSNVKNIREVIFFPTLRPRNRVA